MTYNTEQKKLIISYLKRNKERDISAQELAEELKGFYKDAPSKSTVYRLLPKLCEQGILRRSVSRDGKTALYRLVEQGRCEKHLHMQCVCCGRLYHMEDKFSDTLLNHVLFETGFIVDSAKTTLSGICLNCAEVSV